jgi:hypothetical protein
VLEAVKKPDLQNGFEVLSQLEALRAIIRTSLDIFRVEKMCENKANRFFHSFLFKGAAVAFDLAPIIKMVV